MARGRGRSGYRRLRSTGARPASETVVQLQGLPGARPPPRDTQAGRDARPGRRVTIGLSRESDSESELDLPVTDLNLTRKVGPGARRGVRVDGLRLRVPAVTVGPGPAIR